MRSLVGLAVVSLTLVPTVHAHAQSSAAGRVTIAGKETELGHVRARVNAERTEFVLLLTEEVPRLDEPGIVFRGRPCQRPDAGAGLRAIDDEKDLHVTSQW